MSATSFSIHRSRWDLIRSIWVADSSISCPVVGHPNGDAGRAGTNAAVSKDGAMHFCETVVIGFPEELVPIVVPIRTRASHQDADRK
jgi:hypothetical protein